MLVELTAATSRTPLAIAVETIGEVRDLSARPSHNFELYGRTVLYHRDTRRVKWAVAEPYPEVMRRIAQALAGHPLNPNSPFSCRKWDAPDVPDDPGTPAQPPATTGA